MEQGFGSTGHGPSGQKVVRPDGTNNPQPDKGYSPSGTVSGNWVKLDDKAGEIDASGVGHGHFSEDATGESNSAGPWQQT